MLVAGHKIFEKGTSEISKNNCIYHVIFPKFPEIFSASRFCGREGGANLVSLRVAGIFWVYGGIGVRESPSNSVQGMLRDVIHPLSAIASLLDRTLIEDCMNLRVVSFSLQ